jgi:hypothetical protein
MWSMLISRGQSKAQGNQSNQGLTKVPRARGVNSENFEIRGRGYKLIGFNRQFFGKGPKDVRNKNFLWFKS